MSEDRGVKFAGFSTVFRSIDAALQDALDQLLPNGSAFDLSTYGARVAALAATWEAPADLVGPVTEILLRFGELQEATSDPGNNPGAAFRRLRLTYQDSPLRSAGEDVGFRTIALATCNLLFDLAEGVAPPGSC